MSAEPPRAANRDTVRIIAWARIIVQPLTALLLGLAGGAESTVGLLMLIFLVVRGLLGIRGLRAPNLRLADSVIDVLIPPIVGTSLGISPFYLTPLVGGVMAATLLVLPLKKAVFSVGIGAAALGAYMNDVIPPIPGSAVGDHPMLGQIAVWLGLGLLPALILPLSYRLTSASIQLAAAANAETHATEFKQRTIAMMSHELRTPLTTIRGFAELLETERESLSEAETAEFIHTIAFQAEHLSALADDFLVFMRSEAGALKVESSPIELLGTVESMLKMVADKHTVKLEIPADIRVVANPHRLVQILRNLFENAVKYGGNQIVIAAQNDEETVRIAVSDNGRGVPEDHVDEMFNEFTRADERSVSSGYGLGLPIVKRLVEAMGGTVTYRPSKSGGACFEVGLMRPRQLPHELATATSA